MIYNKHLFNGELDNTSLRELKKLNFTLETSKERIKEVERILKDTEFFNIFSDKFYTPNINSDDLLSENINVFKKLESYADYILKSVDIRKERTIYNFYKDQAEFYKKNNREILHIKRDQQDCEVIDFLLRSNKNHYKSKQQSIKAKDLNRKDELGEILRQYNNIYRILLNKETTCINFYKRLTMAKCIKNDMILIKNTYLGVIESTTTISKNEQTYDNFNWENPKHVKELLLLHKKTEEINDLFFLQIDLDNYVKQMYNLKKIKEIDFTIYKLLKSGYKPIEVSEALKLTRSGISKRINSLSKKISSFAKN